MEKLFETFEDYLNESLSRKDLIARFPIGEVIPITDDNIRAIIENSMVLELQYFGNLKIETLRDVRFYTYGLGNGVKFKKNRKYIRFWHLQGESVTGGDADMLAKGLWRTALQANIVNMIWYGKTFKTTKEGFNPDGDAFMVVDTIWKENKKNK